VSGVLLPCFPGTSTGAIALPLHLLTGRGFPSGRIGDSVHLHSDTPSDAPDETKTRTPARRHVAQFTLVFDRIQSLAAMGGHEARCFARHRRRLVVPTFRFGASRPRLMRIHLSVYGSILLHTSALLVLLFRFQYHRVFPLGFIIDSAQRSYSAFSKFSLAPPSSTPNRVCQHPTEVAAAVVVMASGVSLIATAARSGAFVPWRARFWSYGHFDLTGDDTATSCYPTTNNTTLLPPTFNHGVSGRQPWRFGTTTTARCHSKAIIRDFVFHDQKFTGFASTYLVLFRRVLIAFVGSGYEVEKLDSRSHPGAFCFSFPGSTTTLGGMFPLTPLLRLVFMSNSPFSLSTTG
jgi:hypothetical protein